MKSCLLFLLVPLFFALVGKPSLRAAEIRREEPRAGGPCEYHRYEGQAEVTSVQEIGGSQGKADEKYEVRFKFIPHEKIKELFVRVEGREFLLEINYTSSLSKEFVEQHNIRPGSQFDGCLKAIVKGTCTPILFEFPSLLSK